MDQNQSLKKELRKLALFATLALLALPLFCYWFSVHAEHHFVDELKAQWLDSVASDGSMSAAEISAAKTEIAAVSVEKICDPNEAQYAALRGQLCGVTDDFGQFELARKASVFGLILGVLTLIWIGICALVCMRQPRLQLQAFTAGWWVLRLVGGVEVILQGTLLVWLSFWLTAYFLNIYVIKLILMIGLIAAVSVFTALVAIFKRAEVENHVSGVAILPQQAPQLLRCKTSAYMAAVCSLVCLCCAC
jgi:hypothetical protein